MSMKQEQIDYGKTVLISPEAPAIYHPGEIASTCGLRTVETERQSEQLGVPIGTLMWLVELGDGEALEVPEGYLSLYE
jgi:hypothetical protein